MGSHDYRICLKCKGHTYCDLEGMTIEECQSFLKWSSPKIWHNPGKDSIDLFQQLKFNGKITINGDGK